MYTSTHCGAVAVPRVRRVRPQIAGFVLAASCSGALIASPSQALAESQPEAAASAWRITVRVARPDPVPTYAMNVGVALPAGLTSRPGAGSSLTGKGHTLEGIASYYWQGQMTATGERFDPSQLTAAHKTLPFGTRVRVTRVDTGSSVIVRINDRGPFKPGRVIDLSKRAAEEIGMTGKGLSQVKLEVLGK